MAKAAVVLALCLLALLPVSQAEAGDRTITKVIKLLQEMAVKSKADGEQDTELFAKYKCYCDSNTASKSKAIATAADEIALLNADIKRIQAETGALSTEKAALKVSLSENGDAMTEATSIRDKAKAEFDEKSADMKAAIEQMDQAIETLSGIGADGTAFLGTSKASLLAQSQALNKENVQKVLQVAKLFLPQHQQETFESFLQAPFTGTYQAQSGEIVGILKNMRDTFKTDLESATVAEKAAQEQYDEFSAVKTEEAGNMDDAYEAKDKLTADNDSILSAKQTALEETQTAKAEDEAFLAQMTPVCEQKTKEYEERKVVRSGEEAAIAQATAILNSDAAFDTFGSVDATSFIQLASSNLQRRVARELKLSAKKSKSLRLARVAALLEKGNPLDKVVLEVTEMEALIQKEGAQDKAELDWCNSEREEHTKLMDEKQASMDELNTQIAELENTIENEEDGLRAMLAGEQASLAENQEDQATETEARSNENSAYQKNVHNLKDAQKILAKATKVLKKFYEWLKRKQGPHHYEKKAGKDSGAGNIKRIPEASTEELETACSEDPECAGFNSEGWLKSKIEEDKLYDVKGDLYVKVYDSFLLQRSKGAQEPPETFDETSATDQSEAGGSAVSMLEDIMADTKKEEEDASKAEADAQSAYEETMATLKKQEGSISDSIADLQEQLAEKEKQHAEASEDLAKTTKEHQAEVDYLLKIKPGCDFITENIDVRNEHREAELKSLESAVTTLKDTPAYKKAAAAAEKEALGECAPKCPVGEDKNLACKACIAGITESAYCGGHADDPVCK